MFRKIRELLQANISASESSPWAVMQAKTLFTSCTDIGTSSFLPLFPRSLPARSEFRVANVSRGKQEHAIPEAMDDLDLSPLFDLLTLLGIPRIPASLTNKTGNYIQQMANVKKVMGADIFIGVEVLPDPRNRSRNVIFLDTASLSCCFGTYVSLCVYRGRYYILLLFLLISEIVIVVVAFVSTGNYPFNKQTKLQSYKILRYQCRPTE